MATARAVRESRASPRAGAAGARAKGIDAEKLRTWARALGGTGTPGSRRELALDAASNALIARYPDRTMQTMWEPALPVTVDIPRARFSSWYEMFPRATAG